LLKKAGRGGLITFINLREVADKSGTPIEEDRMSMGKKMK
jgi:hypothetical protein